MSTFIKLLPLELADIHEYREPDREIAPEDNIAGDMSPNLMKLYTLSLIYARRYAEAKIELVYGKPNNDQNLAARAAELDQKTKALVEIFWIAVKDEFSLWDKENIGVRKGFKIVWFERQGPNFGDFLNDILGEGRY